MKIINIFLILIAFPLAIYSQDQHVKGALFVGSTTHIGEHVADKWGEGTRLYLRGTDSSGDPIWMAKYTEVSNRTDLRINIGDDNSGDDRFVIGNVYWNSGNKWKDWFVVTNQGRVGIGVSSPQSQLDVNGTIRAKEVKIESIGWADFVFKPEYKLPTLSEVENHILEHGHLPSIPSESEVKKNGVDVGELQIKLLQKIEELTLYTINLQKENMEIKKELQILKERYP